MGKGGKAEENKEWQGGEAEEKREWQEREGDGVAGEEGRGFWLCKKNSDRASLWCHVILVRRTSVSHIIAYQENNDGALADNKNLST
ncbi:hypothetical protein A2U01_0023584, partial [Trifolium medium]|nr:hypothetical protein [Trifolium medium]